MGFFKTDATIATSSEVQSQQTKTETLSIEGAKKAGEIRKQEAMKRREEFVQSKTTISSSTGKTIQEINAEREEMIKKEVLKIQEESRQMMQRYLEESKRRAEILQMEQEKKAEEEKKQQEILQAAIIERAEKERLRQEEIKRQQELLSQERKRIQEEAAM